MTKKELGDWGEEMAREYLVAQGYGITAHNWKKGHYEIDIIAQKDNNIVFVEVKTREKADVDPVGAVNARKRNHIISSANVFMDMFDIPFEYRFDIITVIGTPENFSIEHIPDAFLPQLKRFNYSFRL